MRIKKNGERYSQDLDIQDMTARPIDPVRLIETNLRNSRGILAGLLQVYGDKLPAKLRSQVALVVKNMESIINQTGDRGTKQYGR